jgi:PKHD-type hydroxylase
MKHYPFPNQCKAITPVIEENFLSPDEIKKVNELIKDIPYKEATVLNNNDSSDKNILMDSVRKSNIKWLPISEEWDWLYHIIRDRINVINKSTWDFNLHSIMEFIQYTEYTGKDKGFYDWHIDIGNDTITNRRKLSITIQLSDSDEYKGGELMVFDGKPIDSAGMAPKKIGTAAIFPSYLLHRVNPVTEGTRKSLVLWMGGSTFK